MEFLNGDDELLKINAGDGLETVVCLTSTGISESISESIETCKMGTKGEQTFIPRLHSYSISFAGIATENESGFLSYADFQALKRDRTLIDWELFSGNPQAGQGYIQSLDKVSQAGDFIQFSGVIVGSGVIIDGILSYLATSDTDLFDTGIGNLLVA